VVRFTPQPLYPRGRVPGIHWIGGWVSPRAGLDDVEKRKFLTLRRLELQPLGRPARSQSLYRLRYPGSQFLLSGVNNEMAVFVFTFCRMFCCGPCVRLYDVWSPVRSMLFCIKNCNGFLLHRWNHSISTFEVVGRSHYEEYYPVGCDAV
jgi:hypothetical protein